jgi:hypothetical protein
MVVNASPTIAQSPMSGPPGTTFVQWGTGFTPNGSAKLHVKKPDGTEYEPWDQDIDASGHFEVTYTTPWNKPPGAYTWWAIDGPTGAKSNEVQYQITGDAQATIAQSPMAGQPGTTFMQWGTGFSPNSKAVLHVKKLDGSEYPTQQIAIDANGHFEISYTAGWNKPPGTYTWWAVDGPTAEQSNEVSYEITTGGASTLQGKVYDSFSNQPLAGARITLKTFSTTAGPDGSYVLTNLPAGSYLLTVGKKGYVQHNENIYVAPSTTVGKDFWLSPASAVTGLRVLSITSRYAGHTCYLDGFSRPVRYTASVDWDGHPPGSVRFMTPKASFDIPTTGNTASREFDMGHDFGVCGQLRVKAISSDGHESDEAVAELSVMPNPAAPVVLKGYDLGDGFYYQSESGLNLDFISEGIDAGIIPEEIPLFGSAPLRLDFIPSLEAKIDSAGRSTFRMEWGDLEAGEVLEKEWGRDHNLKKIIALLEDYAEHGRVDRRRLPKAGVAGFDITLFPYLELNGSFSNPSCSWLWGGSFGIAGEVELKKSWPFIFMAGPVPVPMYAKASVKLAADASLGLVKLDPLQLNGTLGLSPYARGSLGAGVDSVVAVEGWIGGGADLGLQWPETPTLDELTLYLNGGVTVYAFLWKWEHEALRWDWDYLGTTAESRLSLPFLENIRPRLAGRSYLNLPGYGAFTAGWEMRSSHLSEQGVAPKISNAMLQYNIFPYSEPTLSGSGGHLYLGWLYDDPQRTAINRTLLMFSSWDDEGWSEPAAINDNGTADFHPDLLALPDGSAFAAWEDEKQVFDDSATFEDMVKNLEIKVARYDAQNKQWQGVKKLTNNDYLDRSPKLAGVSENDVLLVWIANKGNDIRGGATAPNLLRFSKWNGASWSASQTAATVPYGLVKYDVVYDGTKAHVVMSVDTDNDAATIDDRELFLVPYAGGKWGAKKRLTWNKVADDNPHLGTDPNGDIVLCWLKGGGVVSTKNFAMGSPQTVLKSEYSSNLADFKLANSPAGNIALVWAEASEYSSDLHAMFYDPLFGIWGKPRQLTSDAETEKYLAPAFFGEKSLMVVYDRTLVDILDTTRATLSGRTVTIPVPQPVVTSLYMLKYEIGGDLMLEPHSLLSWPANPKPGETTDLKVNVLNAGDVGAADPLVVFYDGNPAEGGKEIGRTMISGILKPGDAGEARIAWTVPETGTPLEIYAVVDPEQHMEDVDPANNVTNRSLVMADLVLAMATWKKSGDNQYSVTAKVINNGALASLPTNIRFRKDGPQGPIVFQQDIPGLAVNESCYVTMVHDVAESETPAGILFNISVNEEDNVAEYDKGNNTKAVTIPISE